MAGLYLHIPFCAQACHYCDFHFSTSLQYRDELIAALAREIQLQKDFLGKETLETIYFGGGTPSLLTAAELNLLLSGIYAHFPVSSNAEITLEANPDDLNANQVRMLHQAGINRLSIGIQSFDNATLRFLNRTHDAEGAIRTIALARDAGFDNISIDLMFAIPGQTSELWNQNIRQAIELNPEHISAYSLTVEEKTAFGNWARRGKINVVGEEVSATEFEMLMTQLSAAGYQQYEISNFSRPGFHSRHNSSYWQQQKYLGVGPSAHSYNRTIRQMNAANNAKYAKEIAAGVLPCETEILTRENQINEYIFTTLRTIWGCSLKKLKDDWGYDLLQSDPQCISNLMNNNLVSIQTETLFLTEKGKLLADKIASDLFVDENVV